MKLKLTLVIMLVGATFISQISDANNSDKIYFSPQLFQGKNISDELIKKLNNGDSLLAGSYKLDIYINNNFIINSLVTFEDGNGSVQPCFTFDFIKTLGVKSINLPSSNAQNCYFLNELVKSAYTNVNVSTLRLDITIPQADLISIPKGYIPLKDLNSGDSIAFINYLANYYHVDNNHTKSQDSTYVFFNGGVNLGTWQYRQQSTGNYSNNNGTSWNNIRSYIQKPIPKLHGLTKIGQLLTSGQVFSGVNYTGFSFDTDERTYPLSQRGYAPTISGIVDTTATVTVKQNGYKIYQITVPSGQFVIDDLNPTSYNGDLDVEIKEANGTVKHFTVPFSAVSQSLRSGQSKYNIAVGKTRDTASKSFFSDIVYQKGISNSITLNLGSRIANNYIAIASGGVLTNSLGAFGVQTTYTNTRINDYDSNRLTGLRTSLSYSKTIASTDTTISLASYHYSTSGYRELVDVLSLRDKNQKESEQNSNTYLQKNRFDITLSQKIHDSGNLFITASRQDYRNGRPTNNQLQFGYSTVLNNNVSLNIAIAKQKVSSSHNTQGTNETVTSLSLSMPIGSSNNNSNTSLGMNYSHSKDMGSQTQASLTGQLSKYNYTVGLNNLNKSDMRSINGSLQKNFSKANIGINASKGNQYWQAGANIQGSVALHSEGITLGPYLSDTFALVEAKGAEGAQILNAQDTTIDSNGFALVPTLTPYQYNSILIDPKNTNNTVELLENEKKVAPYAGAAVKVSFSTKFGYPLLIKVNTPNHTLIPLGTEVKNSENISIGMVGQNNQIYLRAKKLKDKIYLSWGGDKSSEHCDVSYDASPFYHASSSLTHIIVDCR
ncbi:fimbria/pilus outer membrane usher protein [Providencia sp. PROV197]|uniref:fimbria/pilus outer membrane usher protein n=1 Tax=Providencia sp. PROV197 TaxID=2949898 RepID=UPI00234914A7|nr:fimbria/pilus outer membrane usher protein [Providencia sp. PROV197]